MVFATKFKVCVRTLKKSKRARNLIKSKQENIFLEMKIQTYHLCFISIVQS